MLSLRLQAVFDMIPSTELVADVGTDHAYLPIALIEEKRAQHVYAIDNKKGPLLKAQSNIAQRNLSKQITCLLSDGLSNLPVAVDVIVIAGIGVNNALEILNNSPEIYQKAHLIIVEAKKNLNDLRAWLASKQYTIINEEITYEKHYYQAVAFTPISQKNLHYNDLEIKYGPILFNSNSLVFGNYLEHLKSTRERIYQKHPSQANQLALTEINQIIKDRL